MNLTSTIIAAGCGATQLRAAQWLQPIQAACDKYRIVEPLDVAAFLATTGVESARLVYTREIWGPTLAQQAYEPPSTKASELGNTQPGDGRLFCGRGLIQITGRRNYTLAAVSLDLDLLNHPELLEQAGNAAMSAGWYWFNRKLSALGVDGNFLGVSRAVNLGNATSKAMPNGYTERLALYGAAKKALGIS
ncbi:glycoside hydrolase family 19 protein [Paraburkholderia bryophila]|uniref:Putative chitinase n=1 Tax=Paraburkholderia bryophila TaxID=420952 RepID=A0A7Y9WI91_9BURK|nr:glycoside hydrolase family 19 protein [Paraburkholderia bryophila]NYH21370.1 putative chitinase [Paraburkholderia bryophila]